MALLCLSSLLLRLFYDVTNAFATLLRHIVFDIDQGDEAWLRGLASAGFSEADIGAIYDHIKGMDWVESFSDDAISYSLSKQWYTNTWASHEFIPNCVPLPGVLLAPP